jgi:hypothetical protein
MELLQKRLESFGRGIAWNWTCCSPSQEPTFRALLERLQPRVVLEIGTHQGVSAALLAEYAERVITVDVLPNPACLKVWDALGVTGRIESSVHQSQAGRDSQILSGAGQADLAFIDGSHLMRDLAYDFHLVIRGGCKRIILHDYWQNAEGWPDVKEFADGLISDGAHRYQLGPNTEIICLPVSVEIHKPFVLVEVK